MTALSEGVALPAIDLLGPDGRPIALHRYVGKPFVLYFYPKDDTAGCTREAQDFSDAYSEFRALGAEILGVSRDTPAKHRKFADKYALSVPLATAETDAVLETLGVWVEKKLYGKVYMGIDRSTFLFDSSGVVARAWRKVRVPGHVDAVLEAVRALS